MLLWQKAMIGLARSESMTRRMQGSPRMDRFAARYVGGRDAAGGLARALELREAGIDASLFYLGEYVEDPAEIRATVGALAESAAGLGRSGLDVHLSVDPTQVGAMRSWDDCRDNVRALARTVADNTPGERDPARRDVLMLDMEDSSVTEPTLELYRTLRCRRAARGRHGPGLPAPHPGRSRRIGAGRGDGPAGQGRVRRTRRRGLYLAAGAGRRLPPLHCHPAFPPRPASGACARCSAPTTDAWWTWRPTRPRPTAGSRASGRWRCCSACARTTSGSWWSGACGCGCTCPSGATGGRIPFGGWARTRGTSCSFCAPCLARGR